MKKLTACILLILILMGIAGECLASPPDFAGGISDENVYEEIVFLSGTPVKFTSQGGKFTVKESDKGSVKTVSYTIKLTPASSAVVGSLDRSFKIVTTNQLDAIRGQTIATSEIKSFKESIAIGSDTYTLKKKLRLSVFQVGHYR